MKPVNSVYSVYIYREREREGGRERGEREREGGKREGREREREFTPYIFIFIIYYI